MTYAKHEAPAEGAGEIEGLKRRIKCLEKLAGEQSLRVMQQATRAKDAENELVARSSAPEAREEALGNLLAVIHRDGGHRALEVGTKQAALEAEKIVAGLLAAPSADALRVAVEALEKIKLQRDVGLGTQSIAVEALQAVAALQAEQKGGAA